VKRKPILELISDSSHISTSGTTVNSNNRRRNTIQDSESFSAKYGETTDFVKRGRSWSDFIAKECNRESIMYGKWVKIQVSVARRLESARTEVFHCKFRDNRWFSEI
jgi:hypothetical protein